MRIIFVILSIISLSASKYTNDLSDRLVEVYEKSAPAVVLVVTRDYPGNKASIGEGAGFFITSDGYLATNYHLVSRAARIEIHLEDGRLFFGRVVGSDPKSDLAFVKIDAVDLPFLKLGNSDTIKPGHFVAAIGLPFGLDRSLAHGVVSGVHRKNLKINEIEDYIQTDAAINPGNSGGPLLNLDGEVVGINTGLVAAPGINMSAGIGLAIPSNLVRERLHHLVDHGAIDPNCGLVLNLKSL